MAILLIAWSLINHRGSSGVHAAPRGLAGKKVWNLLLTNFAQSGKRPSAMDKIKKQLVLQYLEKSRKKRNPRLHTQQKCWTSMIDVIRKSGLAPTSAPMSVDVWVSKRWLETSSGRTGEEEDG